MLNSAASKQPAAGRRRPSTLVSLDGADAATRCVVRRCRLLLRSAVRPLLFGAALRLQQFAARSLAAASSGSEWRRCGWRGSSGGGRGGGGGGAGGARVRAEGLLPPFCCAARSTRLRLPRPVGRSVGRLCVPLGCCCRLRYAALSCCTLHSAPLSFAGSFARLLACLTPTLYASGCEFLWPSEAETDCTAALLACLPAPGRLIRQVRAPRLPSAPHHHPPLGLPFRPTCSLPDLVVPNPRLLLPATMPPIPSRTIELGSS